MLLTSPPILQFKSLSLTTPFLHGSTAHLFKPAATSDAKRPSSVAIKAVKPLEGKVVSTKCDKTVAVEVVRMFQHPKYKKRVRKKKKYQAHDPSNQFKVGDLVQLQKSRPISKTKSYLALPAPPRNRPKPKEAAEAEPPKELGVPLESEI